VKFGLVAERRGARPINLMCDSLVASRGGISVWQSRMPSQRERDNHVLGVQGRQSLVAKVTEPTARELCGATRLLCGVAVV
jgi:hypothetical protein